MLTQSLTKYRGAVTNPTPLAPRRRACHPCALVIPTKSRRGRALSVDCLSSVRQASSARLDAHGMDGFDLMDYLTRISTQVVRRNLLR